MRLTHITALVLTAVHAGHRYGFDIMDATGLASGTVYPALRRLEAADLLRSRWEAASTALDDGRPRRRFYELTAEGGRVVIAAQQRLSGAHRFLSGLPQLGEEAP